MLSAEERDEVCDVVETLRGELDDLAVRGLRAAGSDDLRTLESAQKEFTRIGAGHLAERTSDLVGAIKSDDVKAAGCLMRAQTSLRVFERVLTLGNVADALDAAAGTTAPPAPPTKPSPSPTTGTALAEIKKAAPVLEDLTRAVEDLIATGMTTASAATRQKLDVSMKEALRLKLTRLGAALRFVNEEIGRYLAQDETFAGRRFSFFLNRSWLLAGGLLRAVRGGDEAALARLLLAPPAVPVAKLEIVSLGASKRIVKSSASCAFEFRLRALSDAPPVRAGQRLVWSCLFSYTSTFPPEAFLHLPQPQKFLPKLFVDTAPVVIEKAAVALDDAGGGRLILGPDSKVTVGKAKVDWSRYLSFDPAAAAQRLRQHRPSPLDIEVELQEEMVLNDWSVGKPEPRKGRADQVVYPIRTPNLEFDAAVSAGDDGKELRAALDGYVGKKPKAAPLFGLVHYELCRLILQPLAVLESDGPKQLMVGGDHKFDPKTLADLTRAIMNKH